MGIENDRMNVDLICDVELRESLPHEKAANSLQVFLSLNAAPRLHTFGAFKMHVNGLCLPPNRLLEWESDVRGGRAAEVR